ncbi:MAG TPA: branched-chain amino acid ABC transporter permease [Candidatus Binatia bacterium]|jgi:branched-chain amino acid transport system permease protein
MEWLDSFWATYSTLVLTVGTNVLLALSIYITLACGMLTVANAAFMGIGAYAASLLTMNLGAPFLCAVFGGTLLPAVVALAIGPPTLRLSGVYLAMATLAFGEVVRIATLNAEALTGGALGLNGIPQLTNWYDVLAAVAIALYVLLRLAHSRIGRTMIAISQDEVATELMGLNVRAYKLFAFVSGAALAGLAGALNAHFTFFISPNEYGFERGVEILAMGVLGGSGSPWGALIGAVLITLLPELLRGLGHYRPLLNGVILIVIILYSPKGIWEILRSAPRWTRPSATS